MLADPFSRTYSFTVQREASYAVRECAARAAREITVRTSSKITAVFLACALTCAPAMGEESTLVIIELQHRTADEMLPVARQIVEPEGSVSALQNKLLVRGTAAQVAQVREVIGQLDTQPRQLLITVNQGGEIDTRSRARGYSGKIGSGSVTAEIPSELPPDSPSVAVETDGAGVEVHGDRRHSHSNTAASQQLRVLEGREAVIHVGQSVPVSNTYKTPSGVYSQTEYRDATVGFSVLPRVHGDEVTLDISPHADRVSAEQSGAFDVQRLSTTVSGRLGEWIDIGDVTQTQNQESSGIASEKRSRRADSAHVLIKVEEVQ